MKILFVAHSYPPTQYGGVATYSQSIVHALAACGHDLSVLCVDNWLDPSLLHTSEIRVEEIVVEGIPTTRLRFHAQATATWLPLMDVWNPAVEQYAYQHISQCAPDVVHVTGWVGLSPSVMTAAKRVGVPVVLTLTDYGLICPTANLLRGDGGLCTGRKDGVECLGCTWGQQSRTYRLLSGMPLSLRSTFGRILAQSAKAGRRNAGAAQFIVSVNMRNRIYEEVLQMVDAVLAPSEFLRNVFVDIGMVRPDQIRFQAHGHDVERAAAGSRKTFSSALRFAYLGRIVPYKGIHVLLQAFNKIEITDSARLDIYGDLREIPEYGEELHHLISGNPSIVLRGRFGRKQIGEILASVDVLVLPSIWYENAPVVIAEAFAAHVPVVATNLGGMAEFVHHGRDGLLFQRGDSDDLARHLQRFLVEPDLIEQLRNGIVAPKTVQTEAAELDSLYTELQRHGSAVVN